MMESFYREGTIGAILYKSRIISEKDIESALEEQKKTGLRFGETLVNLGMVMQEDIDWALSHQLDIPYVRINEHNVDPAAIELVPASIARKYMLLPLIQTGDELRIAIADPLDKEAVTVVEQVAGCAVSISMGLLREIREMQDHFYGTAEKTSTMGFSSSFFSQAAVEAINADPTGANLLGHLFTYIYSNGLSSLSIKPMKEKITVTGRKGMVSSSIGTFSLMHYGSLVATLRKKAGIVKSDEISTRASLAMDVNGAHALCQVLMMKAGELDYITLRPIVSSSFPGSIAGLETSELNRQTLLKYAGIPHGMVLFSSTEEDERSRLMSVCLKECDRLERESIVISREQRIIDAGSAVLPVGRNDGDMGEWIRAACEHEPDVVAVDELGLDIRVLAAAYKCALRGKLIFGEVPAPGVRAMLRQLRRLNERLPTLLNGVKGLAACRGMRILCPECREQDVTSAPNIHFVNQNTPDVFFAAKGCPACNNTGYSGKKYLVEAVLLDKEAVDVLERSAAGDEMMDFLSKRGFRGIADEAADMLRAGDITAAEYILATIGNGDLIWL